MPLQNYYFSTNIHDVHNDKFLSAFEPIMNSLNLHIITYRIHIIYNYIIHIHNSIHCFDIKADNK